MLFASSSARSLHRSTRIQHPCRVYLLFGILERVIFFIAFHGVSIDNCNWNLRVRGTRERGKCRQSVNGIVSSRRLFKVVFKRRMEERERERDREIYMYVVTSLERELSVKPRPHVCDAGSAYTCHEF